MSTRESNGTLAALTNSPAFPSFFGGGFECSTFFRRSGERMDFIAQTQHDKFARQDYLRLKTQGIRVAREGVRWHLVEAQRGRYDFSSVETVAHAAQETDTVVIWDLCHFGWPEHLDVFKPEFVESLAAYGASFAEWLAKAFEGPAYFVPINEISYYSWAGADEGSMFPFETGRGFELKAQMVRASIATMDAIWSVVPQARFVQTDPIIHVLAHPERPQERHLAEGYRQSQFQAWEMIRGNVLPELGGHEKYLDIIGVNYYPQNQWYYNLRGLERIGEFQPILRDNPDYRPFREILAEVYHRFHRPILIAETGCEHEERPGWLRYVCEETDAALGRGIPVHGICLYPIVNHAGWLDDRHCQNGLWDYASPNGEREIHAPLAGELRRWRRHFDGNRERETRFEIREREMTHR